jgi:hypothetical protein
MPVSVMTKAEVKEMITRLKNVGCKANHDQEAGTVRCFDNGTLVYSALEKGRGGLWICMYYDSARISWSNPCLTKEREAQAKENQSRENARPPRKNSQQTASPWKHPGTNGVVDEHSSHDSEEQGPNEDEDVITPPDIDF